MTAITRSLSAVALALLLAGCSGETDSGATPEAPSANIPATTPQVSPPAAPPAAATPALAIEGEGLRLFDPRSGSARPLAFGMARDPVMAALGHRGAAESGHNPECGAGPLDTVSWADGLTLYFQDGKLAGWAANARGGSGKPAIATAAGVGPGSTRAELEDAYSARVEETTLGTEFSAGGLFGVLDGDRPGSRITVMWAGASCNFR